MRRGCTRGTGAATALSADSGPIHLRAICSLRSICWTGHANWTKQTLLVDIDVKHLRWVNWILADGSQIRSLSGRSAQLEVAKAAQRDYEGVTHKAERLFHEQV